MKLIILLSCVMTTQAGLIETECDSAVINGMYTKWETVVEELVTPDFLAVDRQTNELYFNYWDKNIHSNVNKINLLTNEITPVGPGAPDGSRHVIDIVNKVLYIGGTNGLHKYNLKTHEAIGYGDRDISYVAQMYFKNGLYVRSKYFRSQWFYVPPGSIEYQTADYLRENNVSDFVIDDDNVMYFHNNSGLFLVKIGSNEAVFVKDSDRFISSMAIDPSGYVHALVMQLRETKDAVYLVNKDTLQLEFEYEICSASSIAFDNDGYIIFSSLMSGIHRMKPTKPVGTILFIFIMCLVPLIYFGYFLYRRNKDQYNPPGDNRLQVADNAD